MKKSLVILILLITTGNLFGQSTGNWTNWITLYEEGGKKVQVSYKLSYCKTNGGEQMLAGYSYYRINNEFNKNNCWVRFKFSYVTCEGESRSESVQVDLSNSGIDDNMGQWFPGFKVTNSFFEVEYKDYNYYPKPKENVQTQQSEANERNNNLYESHMTKARAYEDNGDFNNAKTEYQNALSLKPNDISATNSVARIEGKAKQKRIEDEVRKNDKAQERRNQTQTVQTAAYVGALSATGLALFSDIQRTPSDKIFNTGAMRVNGSLGLGGMLIPMYENSETTVYNGNQYVSNYSSNSTGNFTLGLDAGLQFWPYYSNLFGIGFLADGYLGVMPSSGGGFVNISYKLGPQFFIGHEKVKLIGGYSFGARNLSYSYSYSLSLTETSSTGTSNFTFSKFNIGLRTNLLLWESYGMIDVIYFNEQVKDDFRSIKAKGLAFNLAAHKRVGITLEFSWQYPATGVILYELDADGSKKLFIKLGVVRSWDWFKRY